MTGQAGHRRVRHLDEAGSAVDSIDGTDNFFRIVAVTRIKPPIHNIEPNGVLTMTDVYDNVTASRRPRTL
ncbi:hypothetical protein [Kutzneria sp. NPDC052558]|uniref:hypothetical protein n=1 Tax=Kutzneria sp. NPDC052558 TaxID=3364121 RepID=UPI0037C6E91A